MKPLTPRFDDIPQILKDRARWVTWKLETRDGKPTKVPYDPRTGWRAKVDAPATWAALADARRAFEAGGYTGVGFVFNGDGLAGVDLDKCRDAATGTVEPWAVNAVRALDSYTELSVSGTGLHTFVLGKVPGSRRRKGRVEVYDNTRFFVVTGARFDGTPSTVESRQDQLASLCEAAFGTVPVPTPESEADAVPPTAERVEDDVLIERARKAKNGKKFGALFDGDTSGYDSPSQADAALCCLIAFWAGGDAAQIDRVFRRSKLSRPKWDEMRGEQTYGALTIQNAIALWGALGSVEGRGLGVGDTPHAQAPCPVPR